MPYEVKIKKLPKSEVEMEISLPADFLVSARKKALENFALSVEVPGFRRGHVPEKIVIEKVGEAKVLEEAVDILLREHFPKIIEQEKLDTIGKPKISITKLALGNPIEFKVVSAILPDFELPDYKKIASNIVKKSGPSFTEIAVNEKEVENVLLQIRKNKAHIDWHKQNSEADHHNHPDLEKEENLPPLDDKFAKLAGNFQNLEEMKEKIKENIKTEKEYRAKDKLRAEIMEAILKETEIDLPEILIESETEKSLAQIKDDVSRMGGKWEDYLAQSKKEEKDLKKDLRTNSEKKARSQLIFNKIAETEKIEPNKEILENEVRNIMEQYKDADEINARIYVSTILINQEVLRLLERQ